MDNSSSTLRNRIFRAICNVFPTTGDQRLHFHRELVNTVPRLSVANSWHEKSQQEQFWYVPIPIDLSDVPWLIHDYGEPGIRTRGQKFPDCHCKSRKRRQDKSYVSDSSEQKMAAHSTPNQTSSKAYLRHITKPSGDVVNTPTQACVQESGYNTGYTTSSTSSRSSCNGSPFREQNNSTLETSKISALEEEVKRLQQQIAVLIVTQEQMAKQQWVPGDSLQLSHNASASSVSQGSTTLVAIAPPPPPAVTAPPPPPPPAGAPPPPPPPPPPVAPPVKPQKSVQEIIAERRKAKGVKSQPAATSKRIDMSEVLKDLGKVKLKALAKSPGGTPIREKPRDDPNDAAAFIQNALKRKFSLAVAPCSGSPDRDSASGSPGRADTSWSSDAPTPTNYRRMLRPRRERTTASGSARRTLKTCS